MRDRGVGSVLLYDSSGNPAVLQGGDINEDLIVGTGKKGLNVRAVLYGESTASGGNLGKIRPAKLAANNHLGAYGDGVLAVCSTLWRASNNTLSNQAAAIGIVDGDSGVTQASMVSSFFNGGTTFDRARNNHDVTVLASAARTTSTTSATLTNYNARGALIRLSITVAPGGGETLTLFVRSRVGGAVVLVTFAAVTAASDFIFVVYPGAVETIANAALEVQGCPLPRSWDLGVTHSAAGSWTYSVEAGYIL